MPNNIMFLVKKHNKTIKARFFFVFPESAQQLLQILNTLLAWMLPKKKKKKKTDFLGINYGVGGLSRD